jgi:hypothetical protein
MWVYPRSMSGKPAEPPSPPPSLPDPGTADEPSRSSHAADPGTADEPSRSSQAGERFGPLAIARHVKDDGRALILYSSSPEPHGDADGAP